MWYLLIIPLVIIFIMGKRSRALKQEKKLRRKEEVNTYIHHYSLFCKGKTISQIINEYCEIKKENISKFIPCYTKEELNAIIFI